MQVLRIVFFAYILSIYGQDIQYVMDIPLTDSSVWKFADGDVASDSNYDVWVSQTNVYLIGIDEDDDRIFIQSNSSIPTEFQFFVGYASGYDSEDNTLSLVIIPLNDPTVMMEVEFKATNGHPKFRILQRVSLVPGATPSTVWEQISVDDTGDIFAAAVDFMVYVDYNSFTVQYNSTIPSDPYFSVTNATGIAQGFTPVASQLIFYVARASANPAVDGGDLALFKITDDQFIQFDHLSILLTSPSNFIGLGGYGGVGLDLYWFQSEGTSGLVYMWDYKDAILNFVDVTFQNGEVWGSAYCTTPYLENALFVSGIDQYTAGYTLRVFNLTDDNHGFGQIATLYVASDTLPTVSVYDDDFVTVGTRDGASGKLKLATYLFMDNDSSPKKMRYYEKEEVKFSPAPNFYFQLPPTCVDTPQCGPKIGMDCSNSDNCFLDAHQFMCCAECPDDC